LNLLRRYNSLTLATRILLSLTLGVLCGLFFGEGAAMLHPIGTAFIRLLQMSVLPYVAVSLIACLGGMTLQEAGRLASRTGIVLLVTWVIAVSIVLLMGLGFPDWEKASFFSSSVLEAPAQIEFVELYIPANPFHALANGIVPAVVVFSVLLGIALMNVPGKDPLVRGLASLSTALTRVSALVVHVAPLGVFAISASAAGTMTVEEFGNLQVYFMAYIAAWSVMTFVLLPLLVTSFTPLSYRDVVGHTHGALLTAFATGSVFVVLPVLSRNITELLEKAGLENDKANSAVNVIVPTSFSFPSAGTLLVLAFIPFAAWAADQPLSLGQLGSLALAGPASFFSSVMMAIPFLLDLYRLPADLFQQFIVADVVVTRFTNLASAMHTVVLGILGALWMNDRTRFNKRKALRLLVLTVVLPVSAIVGARLLSTAVIDRQYGGYQEFVELDLIVEQVPATLIKDPPAPGPPVAPAGVDDIVERGVLRVGYLKDSLPFAFVNSDARLVGFDVAMAHTLARELDVELEFVLVPAGEVATRLDAGQIDMAMSGLGITTDRARKVEFTRPYLDVTISFIVLDHRRGEFSDMEKVSALAAPRIGVLADPYYSERLQVHLPNAIIVPLQSAREFFAQDQTADEAIDALVFSAEAGSAWSLVYPQYSVAIPRPVVIKQPLAIAAARGNTDLVGFMNNWIELKRSDGTVDRFFRHWITGDDIRPTGQRWSIIRDVLHWVD